MCNSSPSSRGENHGKSAPGCCRSNSKKCNSSIPPAAGIPDSTGNRTLDRGSTRQSVGASGPTAILIAYRHGLRAGELVSLRWDDVDFATGKLHVRRAKGGITSVHPLGAKELRALRRLQRETPPDTRTVHIFVSERLAPLSVPGYQRMVARAGQAAGFPFLIHSHMLRHACGYKLANDGHDTRAIQHYLGHRSIASTVRYTALAPDRFKGFWRD
jgi:type 1 fimbriae regulatory protein FimE